MNRRFCVWVVLILTGPILSGWFSPAMGQISASNGGIPASAQADDAQTAADILGINKFVGDQFALLIGADSAAQSVARKALIAQLGRGAKPSYFVAISKAWTALAGPTLAKSPPPSVSVRLNIAIVTETLTDHGAVLDPQSLVVTLIGDKEPCVSLWGIKAARPLLMVLLQQPKNPGFPIVTGAIVDAVKKHSTSDIAGIIITDAYATLIFDGNHNIPGLTAAQLTPLVGPLVSPILQILEFRSDQFQKGVPDVSGKLQGLQAPGAEKAIGTFLSTNYLQATPGEQKRIVQDLVNLLTYIGQRAALYQYSKDDLTQIRDALRYNASPLKVIVQSAASGLTWLLSPPPACTAKEILDHTKSVYGLIQQDPAFKWLVQPPDVTPIDPPLPPPETSKPVPASPATGTPPGR